MQLVRAGPRNHAAVCAASALANIAANNGINQQSIADCGGVVFSAAVNSLTMYMRDAYKRLDNHPQQSALVKKVLAMFC